MDFRMMEHFQGNSEEISKSNLSQPLAAQMRLSLSLIIPAFVMREVLNLMTAAPLAAQGPSNSTQCVCPALRIVFPVPIFHPVMNVLRDICLTQL